MSHSEPCLTSRMAGSLPGLRGTQEAGPVSTPQARRASVNCGGVSPTCSKQNHLKHVYMKGIAHSFHAHPCLWQVTQADAMPVICKDGLAPTLVGEGERLQSCNPSLTFTLGSHPFLGFNLSEGSFWRGGPSHLGRTQFFHYPENSTRYWPGRG